MEGIVRLVSEETGLFAVETNDGFTVFDTEDIAEIGLGDVMVGNLASPTCESVLNTSTGERIDIYVREIVTTLTDAQGILFND